MAEYDDKQVSFWSDWKPNEMGGEMLRLQGIQEYGNKYMQGKMYTVEWLDMQDKIKVY